MSDRQVRRVSRFIGSQVWAIRESTLDVIVEVLRMRAAGISLSKEEVQARIGAATAPAPSQRGTVVVLPLYGVIAPKINAMTAISGGTSLDLWMAAFRACRDDESVSAIVLDIDSPGGSSYGVMEVADELYKSRGMKPTVAVVNPECASAAYWIACSCGEVVCTPSGVVGSVGCFCVHEDWSKANETMGVKPTYIQYGQFKTEGNPDMPLTEEAVAFFQSHVNAVGEVFTKSNARGRGVSVAKVKSDFGQGRMLLAKDALAAAMIDRIDTLDNVVARLASKRGGRSAMVGASAGSPAIAAELVGGQDAIGLDLASKADISAVAGVASAKPKAETMPPNDDGECEDGYEMDEKDGLCHLVPPAEDEAKAEQAAEADPDSRATLEAQQAAEQAEVIARDVDWLRTV